MKKIGLLCSRGVEKISISGHVRLDLRTEPHVEGGSSLWQESIPESVFVLEVIDAQGLQIVFCAPLARFLLQVIEPLLEMI